MISILACAAGELINNDPAGQIFDDNLLVHIGIGLVVSPGGLLQQAVRLLALPHRVRIPGRLQGQWRILNKSKGLSIINNLYAGKKSQVSVQAGQDADYGSSSSWSNKKILICLLYPDIFYFLYFYVHLKIE